MSGSSSIHRREEKCRQSFDRETEGMGHLGRSRYKVEDNMKLDTVT
jgi:hypothetical protein